jgi:mRNA-degrading endonuclease toxin of MazEF toxin-antitoxin module
VGPAVRRGEVWLAEVGQKSRPVLLLTRTEVIDVRTLATVAEISTSSRGLATEVDFDHVDAGISQPSVINCDGLHTILQSSLTGPLGRVDDEVMRRVCTAINYAVGC